jgi:hypothetical protein
VQLLQLLLQLGGDLLGIFFLVAVAIRGCVASWSLSIVLTVKLVLRWALSFGLVARLGAGRWSAAFVRLSACTARLTLRRGVLTLMLFVHLIL